MHRDDILALFDFNYWANRQILAAIESVPTASPPELEFPHYAASLSG